MKTYLICWLAAISPWLKSPMVELITALSLLTIVVLLTDLEKDAMPVRLLKFALLLVFCVLLPLAVVAVSFTLLVMALGPLAAALILVAGSIALGFVEAGVKAA